MRDLARYSRNHQAISADEQDLLAQKRVLVAGCGGLGGYVIEFLGRIGVGQITAVDGDVFEESNLNRQILATAAVLNRPKAVVARERMAQVNELVTVCSVVARLTAENALELLSGHDLVVDALDNIPSRLLLEDAAQKLHIPLIHGAIAGWCGHVCLVMPGDRLLHAIYEGAAEDGKGEEVFTGNLGFTAAMTACLEAAEAVKVLLNRPHLPCGQLLEVDLLDNRQEQISIFS